jgi:hypothetical protein
MNPDHMVAQICLATGDLLPILAYIIFASIVVGVLLAFALKYVCGAFGRRRARAAGGFQRGGPGRYTRRLMAMFRFRKSLPSSFFLQFE